MEVLPVLIEMEPLEIGGCIFCSEKGSGDHIPAISNISEQVRQYLISERGQRANKFIAYFQNFSNTYDSVENLKRKYDAALIDPRIVALSIATRPDCITEEIALLLKSYMNQYDVWVELGLQTANESIGNNIHRGYTNSQFTTAVSLLQKNGIDIITHIMIGLPGRNTI